MSGSAVIDRRQAETISRSALAAVNASWGKDEIAEVGDDTDIFALIDSFAIVELLLETEGQAESALGRYVPLASETLLDAEASPLHRFGDWVEYVEKQLNNG